MTRRHEVLTTIVEAIAEVEGCSAQELDFSLYEYVETEALLILVTSEQTDWVLSFDIPGHTVEIRGTGEILVDGTVRHELDRPSKQVN